MRRIAHIHGHEDVIGEAVEQRGHIRPTSARVPDAMNAAALDGHEADAPRRCGFGDVIDRKPRGPVACGAALLCRAHHLAELAFVIGLLIGEFRGREHVLGVDDEQQIVMGLQVDIPGAGRRGEVVHRARALGVAHVQHAEAFRKHMTDIGVAAMHHDLHAVGPAALVAMGKDAHVARVIRFRQVGTHW
jgi:hypothetical protein